MFNKGYGHLLLPKVLCKCLAKVMAIYFCPKSFAHVQQSLWTFTFSEVICICLAKLMAISFCPKSFAQVQQRSWPFTFVQSHLHMLSKGYGHLFTFVQSHLHMFSKGYGHLVLPKVICVCLAKVMAIYFCPKSFAYV